MVHTNGEKPLTGKENKECKFLHKGGLYLYVVRTYMFKIVNTTTDTKRF